MSVREKERFSRTLGLAAQLAHDLKLDYYTSDPKRLTLNEALFLVATKKQLSTVGIPQSLSTFPWRVPNRSDISQHLSTDNVRKINQILEQSMKIQMGVIPGTEFDKYILSNACMAVSGLLHVYLKGLGIATDIGKLHLPQVD